MHDFHQLKQYPLGAIRRRISHLTVPPAIIALAITVGSIAVLVALNLLVHKIEVFNSVEDDAYFQKASAMLRGEPYNDPYHPPLYVILTAGFSFLFDRNTFLAGSLISAIAAGLLIGMTYPLARCFLPPRYALFAQLLVAIDTLVIENAIFVSTDALFSALALAIALVGTLQYYRSSWNRTVLAVVLGGLLGLAYLTRYTATFLAPLLIITIWQNTSSLRIKWRMIGLAATVAIVVTSPWLIFNYVHNGSPFANENWRNFALALDGQGDYTFSFLDRYEAQGFFDIVLQQPIDVVRLWLKNLTIVSIAILIVHTSSWALAFFLPVGLINLIKKQKSAAYLISYNIACIAPIVLTFYYNNSRLLLPVTPVLIVVAILGLQNMFSKLGKLSFSYRPLLNIIIGIFFVMIVILPVVRIPSHIRAIYEFQPVEEVVILRQLLESRSNKNLPPLKLVTTYSFIAEFTSHPEQVHTLWISFKDPAFSEKLHSIVSTQRPDYILLSDKTTYGRLREVIDKQRLPACWQLEQDRLTISGSIHLYKNMCS